MDTDALAKRRALPVLDRKNQKQWFELAITLLKSKGLYYIIEQDKIKYAWILGSEHAAQAKASEDSSKDSSMTNTPRSENDGVNNITKGVKGMSFNGIWHVEKGPQYDQDEAKAWYELVICLDDFDQEFAAEFSSTKEKFDNLRLNLKSTFTEEYIFNILMSALPAKYATTIDAIDAQPHTLNAHEKLKKLQRKEERLKAANTDDTATLAKQFNKKCNAKPKGCKFSYGSDKDVEDSDNNGGDQKKGPNRGCYLCGGLHFYQDCKYGKEFMEFVKKEKREAHCRAPARRSGQKTRGKKNKTYAADGSSGDNSSSSTSIASNNDSFDEEAQISRVDAKASKIIPSSWIADSGASAHMTDNPTLFRELIKIRRRHI
ncbi:MAG: hypothetical protein FRX48_03508 [Lasallia pustulata]|uniref:Uncharacterized protein n=1 Tax=Lasallia pustulata TaxID=136370 RepID=A0A5M8PU16_9LECA|nr:MAG: hypothetical protein FRX48_03508 [Lasallia pustulata]